MNLLKPVVALLSVTGLALLGLWLGAVKAPFGHREHRQTPVLAAERVEEELQHRSLWGHHDQQQGGDAQGRFHGAMAMKMGAVRKCHRACGADRACHEKCPRPWASFEQKCQEYQPMAKCHVSCRKAGGGFACHDKCPKPKCPWMARRMQAARACHVGCGRGNFMCHMGCPKPLFKLMHKCGRLEAVMKCHRQCGHGDCACHHKCPKLKHLWHLGLAAKAEKVHALAARAEEKVRKVGKQVEEKIHSAPADATKLAATAEEKLRAAQEKLQAAQEKAHTATDKAQEKIHAAQEKAEEKIHAAQEKAGEKIHKAQEKAHVAVERAHEAAAALKSKLQGVFRAFV